MTRTLEPIYIYIFDSNFRRRLILDYSERSILEVLLPTARLKKEVHFQRCCIRAVAQGGIVHSLQRDSVLAAQMECIIN